MFERIPSSVLDVLEANDLLVYSMRFELVKSGLILHLGAMFPFHKNRWDPLDVKENRELRVDVKKELAKLGYKSKVRSFVFPDTGAKDINDFRVKVLLKKGDVDTTIVDSLKRIRNNVRAQKKRSRLASQL